MEKRNFSSQLDEEYFETVCENGLKIIVFKKPQFNASYAVIATRYGSVNIGFTENGVHYDIPDGTAHFLEHKLFEGEKAPAFERFAKTGASANAYTTFDKTAYLFSATENFYESLEILLDFVSHPYLTEENVKKEQGIIGQEIEMYDDDPNWQTFFRAIDGAYTTHPIKKDIAGTRETISVLTPELLYKIYHHFYCSNNMTLCVAGNVSPEKVVEIANKSFALKPNDNICPDEIIENKGVSAKRSYKKLAVSKPLFGIAVKTELEKVALSDRRKNEVAVSIALELIAGGISNFYNKLYSENALSDFGYEYMTSNGYAVVNLTGVSDDPERIYSEFFKSVKKLTDGKTDENDFETVKKNVYGKYLAAFDSIEDVANMALSADFSGSNVFEPAEIIKSITLSEVTDAAKLAFCEDNASMAVIMPQDE
ncbi:MAG: insulinase family protein [Clostridia bacterium]|nr:insulinase family protein [Clostridia bacterium]